MCVIALRSRGAPVVILPDLRVPRVCMASAGSPHHRLRSFDRSGDGVGLALGGILWQRWSPHRTHRS